MNKKITGIVFFLLVTATCAVGQTKAGSSADAYTIWLSNSKREVIKDNNTGNFPVVSRDFFDDEKVFVLLNPADRKSSGFSVIIKTEGKENDLSVMQFKGSLLPENIRQQVRRSGPEEKVSFSKNVNGNNIILTVYIK